jgi:PAS domain S-box-containing protein
MNIKQDVRALIFATLGRDAEVAQRLVRDVGVRGEVCADLRDVERSLAEDIGFVVLTEESLFNANLSVLSRWVSAQPSWSDLMFIVLTGQGGGAARNPLAQRLSDTLRNVTFLERPFHPMTFLSVARSALKGRLRQYEARASIDKLNESEKRLQIALMAGRLGSWRLDLDTMELQASDEMKTLFGRNPFEPFTYAELLQSLAPDDVARVNAAVKHTLDTGHDYAITYRVVRPDGMVRWAEIRARLVTDEKGRDSLVGVSSDITDRKNYEDNLRRLNEGLEKRVIERTAELETAHKKVLDEISQRERTEDLLRQAQKVEMLGSLTGGVAHDFNNLLMAVMGNLSLLRKHHAKDEKAAMLIDGAMQGAKRGAALTQRLLAFARRQDLKVQAHSIVDLVHGMQALLLRSVGTDVELDIQLPASSALAMVDANQIELALLNLVVNSRDAMPEGGVITVSVETKTVTTPNGLSPGPYIGIVVIDNGIGMDEATLAKCTEPFFSTKELGKGTGLGLSMIHGLALQLNGVLKLTSAPGKGTRAELWMPAASAEALPEVAPVETATEIPAHIEKAIVLVVDDDPLIAMSTASMVEDMGLSVVLAGSGPDALEILRDSKHIDLLLTDYAMPKMTGAQLAVAARKLHPDLPIVLATGYADIPSGANIDLPKLGKPYTQDQLVNAIGHALKKRIH